jgi:DnaJ-class molecular chaperone
MAKRERKTCTSCAGKGSVPCPCSKGQRHTRPCDACQGLGFIFA